MNHIKVGEIYQAEKYRSGSTAQGQWELFTVKDEKGKNEVTIFANNHPVKYAADNCHIKISNITEIKNGKKKDKNSDKWFQTVSFNADVEVIPSDITTNVFEEMDDEDGEIPWDLNL